MAITSDLRQKGLRVTIPRALIWRVLVESREHFTVDALWHRVREEIPEIELSTIYRVVEAFLQAGLVVLTPLPNGVKVVEAQTLFHPHLLCSVCNRLYHIPADTANRLRQVFEDALPGFLVTNVQVLGTGVCPRCAHERTDGPPES